MPTPTRRGSHPDAGSNGAVSIDTFPWDDETVRLDPHHRSGNPRLLAASWAAVLLAPGAIITGMVAAGGGKGPGFLVGFAGLALGILIGSVGVAALSIWGPRTGLAQMPLGRLAFGAANVIPQAFLVLALIAYVSLSDLFGVEALADALGIPFPVALGCIVAIEVTVVIVGVRLMRIIGVLLSAIMAVVAVALLVAAAGVPPAPATGGGGFPLSEFSLAMALGLGGSLTYNVQACDLSRTLPSNTSTRQVFVWVTIGMATPLLVLGGIGAWVSSTSALDDPMGRIQQLLGGGAAATIALVALGISLATANAFNDYSGGLSLVQMGLRIPRVLASLIITISGMGIALIARHTQIGELTSDVILIAGYFTTPWFGVVIVELIARRRQSLPWRVPAPRPRQAALAFLLGYLLLLPFTATPLGNRLAEASPWLSWIGWISRNVLGGGGLGYVAGVLLGFGIYAALRLSPRIRP